MIGTLFQDLSEEAFVLQSLPEMEHNIFVEHMMNFFFELPRFHNIAWTQLNNPDMKGSISLYAHVMYDCLYNNYYNDEETIDATCQVINSIMKLY
jgi:hypothetical protein